MKLLERSARTYLASNLQKTVFAEHAIDEDDGKKGKKKARCRCSRSLTVSDHKVLLMRIAKLANNVVSSCSRLSFSHHIYIIIFIVSFHGMVRISQISEGVS